MTRRTGLGRHRRIADSAGDPLDGLVNLFDIGIVLAVAFLIAGLGLTLNQSAHRLESRTPAATAAATTTTSSGGTSATSGGTSGASTTRVQSLPSPTTAPSVSGHGQALGTVYRLSNGQLVYVQAARAPTR